MGPVTASTADPARAGRLRAPGYLLAVARPPRCAACPGRRFAHRLVPIRRGVTVELPRIASREEWLVARLGLLAKEKELSRAQAALAAERRAVPMVEIGKDYTFTGPHGTARLVDLFEGRSQLIIYHFMWLHPIGQGCPSCSFAVDNMPDPVHLNKGADTTLALVSRAPFEAIERFRKRMGWTLPWYSSDGSDFNYDFHVSFDEAIAPIEYNYKDQQTLQQQGRPRRLRRSRSERVRPRRRPGVPHLLRLRGGRRHDTEHLPVPGSDAIGTAAIRHRVAMARHLRRREAGHARLVHRWLSSGTPGYSAAAHFLTATELRPLE
jgi:predicted dithiol-disulfide oxidoreductase (DUF899 family)